MLASLLLAASDTPSLDKTREFLDELKEKKEVKEDNYEFPFLTVQTARVYDVKADQTAQKLLQQLLKIKTTASKPDMPSIFATGEQLQAIEECSAKKCNMKLLLAEEGKKLSATESKAKTELYHQLVDDRFVAYTKNGTLKGYEDRENNENAIVDMAKGQEFLKFRYPKITQFLVNKEWKNRDKIKNFTKNSFLTEETLVIAPEKLQPIWRLGEVFQFNESASEVFVHLHVYTNHYFDSSVTIYEVIPDKEKSILVVTDVLEVDELKKSGFIRTLFKGKMVDAVSLSQKNFLEKISN